MEQARVPGERNSDRPTVREISAEAVLVDAYADDALTRSRFRSIHAGSAGGRAAPIVPRARRATAPHPRSRDLSRAEQDPARTWPSCRLGRRARGTIGAARPPAEPA